MDFESWNTLYIRSRKISVYTHIYIYIEIHVRIRDGGGGRLLKFFQVFFSCQADLIQRENANLFNCMFLWMIGIFDANDSCNSNEGICSYIHDEDLWEENWRSSKLIKILVRSGHTAQFGISKLKQETNNEHAVRPIRMSLSKAE